MSPDAPRPRRRLVMVLGAAFVLLLVAGGVAAFVLTRGGDVSNENVEFRPEPTATPVPTATATPDAHGEEPFTWAHYGYSKDRRRYFPASATMRPPYRRTWSLTGSILLEFSPIIAGRSLYLLKNNAALYAVSKRTGRVRWKRKLGHLAAASPGAGKGRIFVTILQRGKGIRAGRVVALSARTGRTLWSKRLASRSESSPLVDGDRLYFGSENGTVYSMRLTDGDVRWRYRAGGAVKSALALANGKLFFGDYKGRVHAIRQADGRPVWRTGTSGARFGLSSGRFYSTPAVAFGRVYLGNTDGKVYSFASDNGKLAWTKSTGGYVYASPAVAHVPGGRPTVYAGSYSGRFYALDARTGRVRWSYKDGGKISGGATVIGDIVYFSNIRKKRTIGLGARTGRKVFSFGRGAYNPAISDGRRLYLTGYSSLYALVPKRASFEAMHTRKLGNTGLDVGAIGLGCMGMSWAYGRADEADAIAVIHRALDLGVDFIDTSDMYGPFTNERLVGRALADRRDNAVLATKCGLVVEDAENLVIRRDGSPEHVRAACDASLQRLGVERIDLWYLHRVDPEVPVEESIGAMAEQVSAGKAGALGLSEVDVPTLERAMAVHPIAAVQSELSLWTRDALDEVLPFCREHGIAFVPFSPLGRGFLTGRIQAGASFASNDFRGRNPRFSTEALTANQAITDRVRAVADRVGATPGQVALAWVLAQGEQVVPIPGTKRIEYLEENAAAADLTLSAEDLAELDDLPAPVGARY